MCSVEFSVASVGNGEVERNVSEEHHECDSTEGLPHWVGEEGVNRACRGVRE